MLAADLFFKYWPATAPSSATAAITGGPVNSTPPAAATAVPAQALSSAATAPTQPVSSATGNPAGTWQPVTLPATPPNPAIASAKKLMDAGKVAAARGLLQQQTLASSQDAAWLLARSYDPNYLATVKSPDASGDKDKAAEWYRRWRDIGAQNGVPMDDVRLNRLIETLD